MRRLLFKFPPEIRIALFSKGCPKAPYTVLEIEVLLTFAEYISGTVDVGIGRPAVSETVQAAPDSFPAERSCIGGIRLVYGNVVQIQAAGLRSIRFFLFQIGYPVAFTQLFQGTAQIAQADKRKESSGETVIKGNLSVSFADPTNHELRATNYHFFGSTIYVVWSVKMT